MPPGVRPKPLVTLVVLLVALGSASCSDGDASSADPAPAAPTSGAPADTPTSSEPATPEPTASESTGPELPFPGVAPTTGRLLRETSVEITAPTGWHLVPPILSTDSGVARGSGEFLILTDQRAMGAGLGLPELSDAEAAALMLKDARAEGGTYERVDDVVVDGVSFVRISGTNDRGRRYEEIEVERKGRLVNVAFAFRPQLLEEEPDIVEAVFNSLTWR